MKKILDITTTSQGAYRLLRLRISEINKNCEFSNSILCPPGPEVELMRSEGIPLHTIHISRSLNPFILPFEISSMIKIFKKVKPDIVHSHNSKAGGVSRLAVFFFNKNKRNKKIFIIHQVHGFVFSKYSGLMKYFYVTMEKILSRFTDVLLFQNSNDLHFAEKNNFGKNAKLLKIGNGISFSELKKNENCNNINAIKSIVCVARLEQVKNQIMLIKALAILKEKYNFSKFKCTLIGEGNNEKYLEQILRLGLGSHVVFSGKVSRDDIVKYYCKADLNVLTSFSEGMPRALMEAIYMGVPSIGTNVVGTTEVIKPGISGELVELGDLAGLAKLMYDLLNDKQRNDKLRISGIQYAQENFNEKEVIKRLCNVYTSIK